MFEELNFGEGVIEKIIIEEINGMEDLEESLRSGYSNFFDVEYDNNYIISLSLREDKDLKKIFIIQILEDGNWEKPYYVKSQESFDEIMKEIKEAIDIVQNLRNNKEVRNKVF